MSNIDHRPNDPLRSPRESEGRRSADLDDYFASRQKLRVIYQTTSYFLPQIVDLLDTQDKINIRPVYQRRLRWPNTKKSALIESMLLNIPVPPIYLYEDKAARYEVMDGQQRLAAIQEFLSDDLRLTGLRVLSGLNGLTYSKCPQRALRALDRASISAIVLLLESDISFAAAPEIKPNDLRRLVFERLNTGGKNLNAQEIRHAMNPGPLDRAIVRMTRLPVFTEIFDIPPYGQAAHRNKEDDENEHPRQKTQLYSSMKDCELALRFVAFRDADNIRGAMKQMLDRAMETELTEDQAKDLVRDFEERLKFLYTLFDGRPFRVNDGSRQHRPYYAMYDAAMAAIDQHWERRMFIMARAESIREQMNRAFANEGQHELLTASRNTADAVRSRIALFSNILLEAVA